MPLKQPRSRKALAAKWALASLVMRPNVHGVGGHGHICFLAMGTLSGLFILEGSVNDRIVLAAQNALLAFVSLPVCLSMPGQVAGCAVGLAAIRTFVLSLFLRSA